MALFNLLLTSLTAFLASFPTDVGGGVLYLLHRGESEKAFSKYLEHADSIGSHDFSLLQEAAIRLLEEGFASGDPEIQLMCMFGAGVATSSELIPLLEKGLQSKDMRTQLIALSYLGKLQDDSADQILLESLGSPFLLTRLEALLQLAQKNHPAVMSQLQSLMVKVPPPIRPIFAQIAILVEGVEANRFIRQLLNDADVDVRIEAILAVAEAGRDDFLQSIRTLACGAHHAEEESCAWAFGILKDTESLDKLRDFAASIRDTTKLAACIALYELGEREFLDVIKKEALSGSLYAIGALGKLRAGENELASLLDHSQRDIRLNAALSLLSMRDPRALPHLKEILFVDGRDIGFTRISSPGGALKAWKTVTSAAAHSKKYPGLLEQTLQLREKVLAACIEFEEKDFLSIAQLIFDKKQSALIPLLVQLLQNRKSDAVLNLLRQGYQKAGAPLIRIYCTLALYKLKEEGPYEAELIAWLKGAGNAQLIQFREEDVQASFSHSHALTPEEASQLLVDTCETLAAAQNQTALKALIHTIAYGNPKNRYALAGLLMRTTE